MIVKNQNIVSEKFRITNHPGFVVLFGLSLECNTLTEQCVI